jgi:hypothetical protein
MGIKEDMTIVFFSGPPRIGKTLALTFIGYYDRKKGRKIYANYPVYYEHYHLPTPESILDFGFKDMDISPKTFLIQEADKWFDSRASWREENRILTSFTGQSGKRNIDIYYDSQFPTRIDKGLRDVTNFKVDCDVLRDDNENPIIFIQYWNDVWHPHKSFERRYPWFIMEPFYKLYKTVEPTMPLLEDRFKSDN